MSKVTNRTTCLMMPVLLLATLCTVAAGKIIYVDDDAAGANNGSSWENAYVYLQDALADANSAEKPVEIRVAQGVYKPDQGANQTPGEREATFQLINGVTVKGSHGGLGESDPNARDIQAYETILSGDLNGDDMEVADPCDLLDDHTRVENSYNVVTAISVQSTATLDGFTIESGNADGSDSNGCGGGLYISGSSSLDKADPVVANCRIMDNSADSGGGIACVQYGSLTMTNCTFANNASRNDGGGLWSNTLYYALPVRSNNCTFTGNYAGGNGGGVLDSGPTMIGCTFIENRSDSTGGGMRCDGNSTLTDCSFIGNQAQGGYDEGHGGGLYFGGTGTLINCTFMDNQAFGLSGYRRGTGSRGGGMFITGAHDLISCVFTGNSSGLGGGVCINSYSSITLTNCTFSGNLAKGDNVQSGLGGGIYIDWGIGTLNNCILWGNLDNEGTGESAQISNVSGWKLYYCCIQDDNPGDNRIPSGKGNIDVDPLFIDPGHWDLNGTPDDPNDDFWVDGDYHLKSQTGRWDPNSESWVHDDMTSPCIDAGDPNSDSSGETWPYGERINMGAYGGTRQASMSLETQGLTLPRVAYIFSYDAEAAESFQSLLGSYGCSTTLFRLADVTATLLDSYDLIIVANDTQHEDTWSDPNTVAAIEDSGKPIVGLGDGGYDFFGLLGLAIGYPNGGHGSKNSIEVIDPNSSLFSMPYSIEIPEDRVLQLYTETHHVGLYFWPIIPETVTALAGEVNNHGYYPLATEYNRYLLWGFAASPQKMTEIGKTLFINVVIHAANEAWESKN